MTEKKSQLRILLSILATGIMIFCGMVIETAMNIVFPTLMKEFHISTATVQWMTTSYLLVVSIIVPISAYLKRQYHTKALFIFAITFFIIGVITDSVASNFPLLLTGRVIQGIGTGVALPLMFNIIIDEVPPEKLGVMMAVGTLVTAVGPAVGPTLGGIISYYLNWHFIFIFLLPLLALALILGLLNINQAKPLHKGPFDFHNFIFIPIMFIGLIFGFSNISTHGLFSSLTMVPLLIGVIGIGGFIHSSLKAKAPIINVRIFKNISFSFHVLAFTLIQMTLLGLGFVLPNFTQIVLEQNELTAALQLLAGAIIGAIFTIFSGRILDILGARLPIRFGTVLVVFALFAFAIMRVQLTVLWIILIYAVFMLGVGLALGNIMTNGIKIAPAKFKADGNAVFNVVQQFAGALGTTLVSAIVATVQSGKVGTNYYQQTTSLGTAWSFATLLVLTVIACIMMWKTLQRE